MALSRGRVSRGVSSFIWCRHATNFQCAPAISHSAEWGHSARTAKQRRTINTHNDAIADGAPLALSLPSWTRYALCRIMDKNDRKFLFVFSPSPLSTSTVKRYSDRRTINSIVIPGIRCVACFSIVLPAMSEGCNNRINRSKAVLTPCSLSFWLG